MTTDNDLLVAKIKHNGTYHNEATGITVETETRLHRNDKALLAVVETLKAYGDGVVRVNPEFNQGIWALSAVLMGAIEKELG